MEGGEGREGLGKDTEGGCRTPTPLFVQKSAKSNRGHQALE